MMLPSILEKLLYTAATTLLHFYGRLDVTTWYISLVDLIFLVVFAASWQCTKTTRWNV
jgi:hypothetical protein